VSRQKGGGAPSTAPTAWAFFGDRRSPGFTIRWKKGDTVAYVLSGRRDDHGMHDLLDTIPVLPQGWTDQAEVRQLGERWVRARSTSTHAK
jgi:FtsP/CotA-like multicopper oxidase with cupredoxin domain